MAFVSLRKRVRVQPRIEALEDRHVPAILFPINQTGTTLSIVCDNGPDNLVLGDNGRGAIDLTVDGNFFTTFTGVNTLNLNTAGGNDTVVYNLFDNLIIGQTRTVNVALGAGKDSFAANLKGRTLKSDLFGSAAASLTFNIQGNQGDDHIAMNAQNLAIQLKATLAENLTGGKGSDRISANYSGRLDGVFNPQIDGNPGTNVIKVLVDVNDPNSLGTLGIGPSGSTAATTSKIKGTLGNNRFTYIIHSKQPKPSSNLFAEIDAGTGEFDSATFTTGLVVLKGTFKGGKQALPFIP
jgi:hypothetical protein